MSNINFSDQEIKDILKHSLTGPHKDLLADAIMGLLDSSFEKGALLKALLGTKRTSELTIGEEYYVVANHVSNYQFNEDKMRETNMITSSNQMKCILVKFDPWQNNPYRIEYKYLDDKGKEKSTTYNVDTHSLQVVEEFPEDF